MGLVLYPFYLKIFNCEMFDKNNAFCNVHIILFSQVIIYL